MSRNELVDLTLHQHHETHAVDPERGAYLVSDDGDGTKAVWLPKSQCERGPAKGRGIYEFAVVEWIAQGADLMAGYTYGEQQPLEQCPWCGAQCEADFVNIGVGYTQCGPYHCSACGASEIGPYDDERALSAEERAKGWYAPGAPPGSSANVIGGRVVGHKEMEAAYKAEFSGNPRWHDKGFVRAWFDRIRRG